MYDVRCSPAQRHLKTETTHDCHSKVLLFVNSCIAYSFARCFLPFTLGTNLCTVRMQVKEFIVYFCGKTNTSLHVAHHGEECWAAAISFSAKHWSFRTLVCSANISLWCMRHCRSIELFAAIFNSTWSVTLWKAFDGGECFRTKIYRGWTFSILNAIFYGNI